MRTVNGVKVAFIESAAYFATFGKPSMRSVAKETGADIVLLLADGKTEADVTDEEIRDVLNGIADAKEESFPAAPAQPDGVE